MPSASKQIFAFSDYTFDCDTGTLSRKTWSTRLPEKTARLLEILLEHANSLVTREELRLRLWPDEEFLDYDQGINVTVNRLRNVLREDSRNPQFLRTIPKRGYSFCGDVRSTSPNTSTGNQLMVVEAAAAPTSNEASATDSLGASSSEFITDSHTSLPPVLLEMERTTPQVFSPPPSMEYRLQRTTRRPTMWLGIPAVAILIAGGLFYSFHRTKPSPPLRLGIAPLHTSGAAQSREVAESFRMELTDAASRLPSVQVPAAGSFTSSDPMDIPRISRQLNLDELLLGSISQQGEEYDLTFELIRAKDATHLASFEYSGPRRDLPAISDRLQQDIFHYLHSGMDNVQSTKGSTNNAQAYELYLQGAYHSLQRNPDSLSRSIAEFASATSLDPNFAAAYAGAATSYLKLSAYDSKPQDGLLSKAETLAQRAVKLDPLSAQAHAVLGCTAYKQDHDFARGETELREAIHLDPSQATYNNWLSVLLVEEGRFDEAMAVLNSAQINSPFWPSVYAMEGLVGVYARRDEVAITAARKYVNLLPNLPTAHNTMAWVYFETLHYKEAIEEWRQMALLQNDPTRVDMETHGLEAFQKGGVRAYAQLRLDAIRENKGVNQVNDFMPAEWDACAGKREESLAELEKLATANDPYMLHAGVDPLYDSFHHDARFITILARSGIMIPTVLQNADSRLCR